MSPGHLTACGALLYYDFMIGGEGQRILEERGFVPTSRRRGHPLTAESLKIVHPTLVLDEAEKWNRLYESIFRVVR